ncbi:YlxR family protein [Kibdelosporangium lantanae]
MGCKARALAEELLRVVVADGNLVPDPRRRHAGRGAWLHPTPACLDSAEKRRAFPRALRVPGPLDASEVRALVGRLERSSDRGPGMDPGLAGTQEAGRPVMSQP